MNFLLADVSNTYKETKENIVDHEDVECIIRDNFAQLSANDGEYIWTWHAVKMPN